ncbi:hypothetical protein OHB54_30790 [Streptomyces sp. NBC_01007]|nr:hypothetical protein OHB54_30790 [Streptomyces sp. NBC_01007]
MQAKGLYGQARGEFEAVLAQRRAILGDTHPDTLAVRHDLANL